MTYELCKKLKDAGFPQTVVEGMPFYTQKTLYGYVDEWHIELHEVGHFAVLFDEKEDIKHPDLDELIYECGDQFIELRLETRYRLTIDDPLFKWTAKGTDKNKIYFVSEGIRSEAVAGLWLMMKEGEKA